MAQQTRGLLPGTVDLVILQTLTQIPLHGFAISRSIRARSEGELELQDAALYKALHRLERAGWVEAEWGISEKGRRAKYYKLTTAGNQQLEHEVGFWRTYAAAVFKVLEPMGQGSWRWPATSDGRSG
jgi:PadR family transcriptional regulator PadR